MPKVMTETRRNFDPRKTSCRVKSTS